MEAKLTRLTHKIAIQLHLVAESCTICSSRSKQPVRKLLDTPSYMDVATKLRFLPVLETEPRTFRPKRTNFFTERLHVLFTNIENSACRIFTFLCWLSENSLTLVDSLHLSCVVISHCEVSGWLCCRVRM